MKRIANELVAVGGWVGCCAAAVQISQLIDGRAAPELVNYAVTALTAVVGLGLSVLGLWMRRRSAMPMKDDQAIVAALDRLFAHFPDDEAALEAVRVVARAVTERRYRRVKS